MKGGFPLHATMLNDDTNAHLVQRDQLNSQQIVLRISLVNIATGETLQDIIHVHFFDYFNFYNQNGHICQ